MACTMPIIISLVLSKYSKNCCSMSKKLPKHLIDLENQISHVHPYQHMSTLFQACEREKMLEQFFESNLIHMLLALDKFCNVCFYASIKLCLEKNIYPSNSKASSLHSMRIFATIQVITN